MLLFASPALYLLLALGRRLLVGMLLEEYELRDPVLRGELTAAPVMLPKPLTDVSGRSRVRPGAEPGRSGSAAIDRAESV